MNLISGVLLTLWVAGWAVASLRAIRQARAATRPDITQPEFTLNQAFPADSRMP